MGRMRTNRHKNDCVLSITVASSAVMRHEYLEIEAVVK